MVHGRPDVNSPRLLLPKSGAVGNVGNDVKRQSASDVTRYIGYLFPLNM
jgi:hypothetical protein